MKIKSLFIFIFIGLCCALLLTLLYHLTYSRINENQQTVFSTQLTQLINKVDYDNQPQKKPLFIQNSAALGTDKKMPVYILKKSNIPVAFVFNAVAPDGYNGNIYLLIALNTHATVLGVRVIKHHETPGLGDYFDKKDHAWLSQFIGKNKETTPQKKWEVRRDGGEFDAWTGATITPRAIIHATARVVNYFNEHREELLQ